jgi:hypothetical protein
VRLAIDIEEGLVKVCVVCEGLHFRRATYDCPPHCVRLPALACASCGTLDLDDRRAGLIADALGSPHVARLSGLSLRIEVQRLLGAPSLGTTRRSRLH